MELRRSTIAFLIFFFLCFDLASAATLAEWKRQVVKISQTFPTNNKLRPQGSGFIFHVSGSSGFVTSEHVFLPIANASTSVFGEGGFLQDAQVARMSYAKGLALLSSLQLPSDQLLNEKIGLPTAHSEIFALGYPSGSKTLQIIGPGRITQVSSQRAIIPGIRTVIEVADLPVEFGMSGGPLLMKTGENDYRLIGMISHQFLRREPGKKTKTDIGSSENAMAPTDLALAIPIAEIQDWLTQPEPKLNWTRTWNTKLFRDEVSFGPLIFRTIIPTHSKAPGIGGADGSGVGGSETERAFGIAIELNENWSGDTTDLGNELLNEWYQRLLRKEVLEINQVAMPNQLISVDSIDQFLTLWLRDQARPLVVSGRSDDLDPQLPSLKQKIKRVRSALAAVRASALQKQPEIMEWLNVIEGQASLVNNLYLKPQSLAEFLGDSHRGIWQKIVLEDFDLAVELESALQDLCA